MTNNTNNQDQNLDFGSVNGQIYTNRYFGLKVNVPEKWRVAENIKYTQSLSPNKNIYVNDPLDASTYNEVALLLISLSTGTDKIQSFRMLQLKLVQHLEILKNF